MKTRLIVFVIVLMVTVLGISAQKPDVTGTWRLVESTTNTAPENYKIYKFITPTHFIWTLTDENGNILSGASGTYYVNDKDIYTEEITMVLPGMRNFQNKKGIYKVEMEGKMMKMTGTLDEKIEITETWEKID